MRTTESNRAMNVYLPKNIRQFKIYFLLLLAAIILTSCYKTEKADLVIHNANIYTVNENFDIHQAMAIKDGKILALGAEREILNRYSTEETVDARQKFVYPGFYDAHAHFTGYATNMGELNLFGVSSEDELTRRVIEFASKTDRDWIVGRGWTTLPGRCQLPVERAIGQFVSRSTEYS